MGDNEERFKTTTFGGYDKEEVLQELQKMKENAHAEKAQILRDLEEARRNCARLSKELQAKDGKIAELQETIVSKDREIMEMERSVREKYQSYIDNYETIGSLIYESKIRAKQIAKETEEERRNILSEAQAEAAKIREEAELTAQKRLQDIQVEIDDRTTAGRQQFEFVQDELNNALELFSKLQKQFMQSYKSIQEIVREHPGPGIDEENQIIPEQEAGSGE